MRFFDKKEKFNIPKKFNTSKNFLPAKLFSNNNLERHFYEVKLTWEYGNKTTFNQTILFNTRKTDESYILKSIKRKLNLKIKERKSINLKHYKKLPTKRKKDYKITLKKIKWIGKAIF
jgi:hypothetical protein